MNLAFLASHNGSNMQAIIDACKNGIISNDAPCVVISNNSKSGALEKAKRENIPGYHLNSFTFKDQSDPDLALDLAIRDSLLRHNIDLVILAGFMKKIGEKLGLLFPAE